VRKEPLTEKELRMQSASFALALLWSLQTTDSVAFRSPEGGRESSWSVRLTETTTLETRLDLGAQEIDGGRQDTLLEVNWTETVLHSAANEPQRIVMEYMEAVQRSDGPRGPAEQPLPVQSNTYLLERGESGWQISYLPPADNELPEGLVLPDVQAAEAEIVMSHASRWLDHAVLTDLLQRAPVRVGQVLEADQAIARYLLADPAVHVNRMEWRLVAVTGEGAGRIARFEVLCTSDADLAAPMRGRSEWKTKGHMDVSIATTSLAELYLEGPLRLDGSVSQSGIQLAIEGTGQAVRNVQISRRRPQDE
jgi:hypothetical protein